MANFLERYNKANEKFLNKERGETISKFIERYSGELIRPVFVKSNRSISEALSDALGETQQMNEEFEKEYNEFLKNLKKEMNSNEDSQEVVEEKDVKNKASKRTKKVSK